MEGKLYWNCQGHEVFQDGCEDCEQITREMQPDYCVMGMNQEESPHELCIQMDGVTWRCWRCGYAKKPQG